MIDSTSLKMEMAMKKIFVFVSLGLVFIGLGANANSATIAKAMFISDFEHSLFGSDGSNYRKKMNLAFTKRLTLVINDEVNPVSTMTDWDSPKRKYSVGVTASIDIKDTFSNAQWKTGDERCDRINFDVYWTESENILTTKELLDSLIDSKPNQYDHYLCFGYKLSIPSVRKLMIPGSEQEVSIFVRGIEAPIAKGILITEKAPAQSSSPVVDDSHDRD